MTTAKPDNPQAMKKKFKRMSREDRHAANKTREFFDALRDKPPKASWQDDHRRKKRERLF